MGVFILSQGVDPGLLLMRVVELFGNVVKMVTEGYQNKTLKDELKEEKENGKTGKAKSLGAMRETTNEFLEQNFEGKYEPYKDPESGIEKHIFKASTNDEGMPILKSGSEIEKAAKSLAQKALKNCKGDLSKFKKAFGDFAKEFTDGRLTSLFRNHLRDSKDPELAQYASSIQSDATIQNLFDAIKKKVEGINASKGSLRDVKSDDLFKDGRN